MCRNHDTGKLALVRECLDAKLVHDNEVYRPHAGLISAEAAAQCEALEWAEQGRDLAEDAKPCLRDCLTTL